MRMLVVTTMALLTSGCAFGLFAITPATDVYENPDPGWPNMSQPLILKSGTGDGKGQTVTTKHVIRYWGEASEKGVEGDVEIWTYDDKGYRWVGLMPAVFLPVPLVIPIGKERWTLRIKNGVVVHAEHKATSNHGLICNFAPSLSDAPRDVCETGD